MGNCVEKVKNHCVKITSGLLIQCNAGCMNLRLQVI